MSTAPVEDVREISKIGYGFMASKALFVALDLELFGRLAAGPKALAELAQETGIAEHRLRTLVSALVGLGLLVETDDALSNAPASQAYLVPGAPAFFGDYFRYQVDRQVYPHLTQLDAALRGEAKPFYEMLHDPEQAEIFTRAQHCGSLGPARLLARQVDLSGARRMLDVAGGSGAFSIVLCERHPELRSTILDFPTVVEVARDFVEEAGLNDRIDTLAGNALDTEWPGGQDVVLFSYLLSAVPADAIGVLFSKALACLAPGGRLLVHDFMLDDDRRGPTAAALWFLAFVSDPGAVSLTPSELESAARKAGFEQVATRDLIPGLTRTLEARSSSLRMCPRAPRA
jgi:cyclopropane fatty-acyl-phospholipid synthase-like methyltransferase